MISSVGLWPSDLVRLFLPPPKKSPPFFSAPKKPKKSSHGVHPRTLGRHSPGRQARLHGIFACRIIEAETAAAWNEQIDLIAKDWARAAWSEFFCHSAWA